MKKILPLIVLSTVASPVVFADSYFNRPYLGVEIIQTNQDFKTAYGKDVFKKNPQDYSLFAGFSFSKYFGVEGGYEFQPKRSKNVNLGPGAYVPSANGDVQLSSVETITGTSSYKSTSPYVGLFAEYMFWKKSSIKGLIGASFTHVNAEYTLTNLVNGANPLTFFRSYSETKVIPIAKIIAATQVSNHFGVRLSVQYQNMSSFKITADQTAANSSKPLIKMKDS